MKRPAIFLDRDGVLCAERGYVTKPEQLDIFSYTPKCISHLKELGFYTICITNQSAVGRGMLTLQELEQIHIKLLKTTGLDKIYVCPHSPQDNCECRKPKTKLLGQAKQDFNIDMSLSILVGDRASDILCGQQIGIKTVLLESGYGKNRLEQPVNPDYMMDDLVSFTFKFLHEYIKFNKIRDKHL